MTSLFADETLGPETEYEIRSKPIKEDINRIFNPRLAVVLENYFGPGPMKQLYEKIALADTLKNLPLLNEALDLTRKYRDIVMHMFHASAARDYMHPKTDIDLEPLLNEIKVNDVYGSNIDASPVSNVYKQGNITFRVVKRGSAEGKAEGKKRKTKKRRKGRKAVRAKAVLANLGQFPRGKKKKKKTYKKK